MPAPIWLRSSMSVALLLAMAALCGEVREASGQATSPPQQQRSAGPAGTGFPVQVGQSFRDCPECPEMVVIPAGRFVMGSPANEKGRYANEGPQRDVALRTPLAVGRFEITFAEWDACVAARGCSHRPNDRGLGPRPPASDGCKLGRCAAICPVAAGAYGASVSAAD
ncbi:MAG: SUMF1/EgtB/PvdO family nonheme iron enzyme [Roseomonas sp.]|nr:SUMF1/EgtB/PvdO family nonheme iron enzyme [Roseomonas sp.]